MSIRLLTLCKAKVENAVITDANLNYKGSLTVDGAILEKARIYPFEKVLVVNYSTGDRFETYAIPGDRDSGAICLNGGTARLGQVGDKIGFLAFIQVDEEAAEGYKPVIVSLNGNNKL